jgi:putative ABC transporter-associated repeat protein
VTTIRPLGNGVRAVALLALATVLSAVPLLFAAGPAGAGAERTVISDGHVDMGPRVVDGKWILQVRDDTASPPVWRELDTVVLHGSPETKITIPDGDTYAFLGKPGAEVYVLPQVQRSGIIWPGWNTQDPSVVDGVTGDITWTVSKVDGPGNFHLFLTDSFGKPALIFDGAKSYPQSTKVKPNTHAHGNWAFSKPGIYKIQTQMSATSTTGKAFTDTRTVVLAIAADAVGIPVGGAPGTGNGGTGGDGAGGGGTGGSGTGGSGPGNGGTGNSGGVPGSGAPGGGELPNTGGGFLVPLVGGAVTLLVAGILLRTVSRRRSLVSNAPSGS